MINTFDHNGNNFLAHENKVRIVTSYKSKIFLVNSYFRKKYSKTKPNLAKSCCTLYVRSHHQGVYRSYTLLFLNNQNHPTAIKPALIINNKHNNNYRIVETSKVIQYGLRNKKIIQHKKVNHH